MTRSSVVPPVFEVSVNPSCDEGEEMLNDRYIVIDRKAALTGGHDAWQSLAGPPDQQASEASWVDAIVDGNARAGILRRLTAGTADRQPFGAEVQLRRGNGEVRWVALRFVPHAAANGTWLGIVSDIDVEKHREEAADLLARTDALFVSDADERAIMKTLAGIAVPSFADWCTVHLLRDDGAIENVAVVGGEPPETEILHGLERFTRLAPDAPLQKALHTSSVQLQPCVSDSFIREHLAVDRADGGFLLALGIHSLIVAPIVIRGVSAGAIRFIRTRTNPFCERDAALAMDMTRRAALAVEGSRARGEALAAAHSRDIFLATLSHEMRTPLTSILGWTQMLRAEGAESELFAEALGAIEQSATVQQRLIEDLLDVSRIITGKLHFEFTPVEIASLVGTTLETLVPRARDAGQHIRLALSGNYSVYGDATRLRQAIWNILTNAMKYTPAGGLIEVTTLCEEETIAISVRDTGRGIRADVLPHVFDRFHQATVSDRARHGGLGLGLAIVRNIVERHGGAVAAESPGEGKGATFTIRLPLYRGETGDDATTERDEGSDD